MLETKIIYMRKYIVYLLLALFITTPLANVLAQGTNYRYTGQERDSASNLYYYGQRYYQPEVGRFTQPDPVSKYLTNPQRLKQATGQDLQEFLENPQKLNDYSYTINNPVKYTDPSGESVQLAWIVFSGLFLSNIETAHAPTLNSTPATLLQYKSIGDILPGLKDIPKGLRNGLAVMGAIVMPSSSGQKIIRKSDDIVKLFHVTDKNFTQIIKEGFDPKLDTFFTNVSGKNPFKFNHILNRARYNVERMTDKAEDYGEVAVELPAKVYEKLVSSGLLRNFFDESKAYAGEAMSIINQYVIKK